ncbi:MAG TPA: FAD-linked oxidase C-terminal domain-containing protein [Solirubrobacteraceae bacterium]|nr:FAD-linked oxidase C-terminal domain-containing protein [Solirubrobacteraceae bacterium]
MTATSATAAERELRVLLGDGAVLAGSTREYLHDATESRGVSGRADAVALPADAAQVADIVAWCYDHDVPIVPRGGGTGFTGGAVPDGGVVLSLERLREPVALEPELWRARATAGVTTAELARRARETGLFYPPDPGAAEQSQLGGNIATNAGGPHTFKYGVTGTWVTGLELVLAPGELVTVGGPVRKDVAGYDIKSLMAGSEGTLGIVTAAWLRLVPAPAAQLPVVALYPDAMTGCAALEAVLANGLQPAALEYLDEGAVAGSIGAFPGEAPDRPAFMLIAEADGSSVAETERLRDELLEVLAGDALATHVPDDRRAVRELWQWRSGVSLAVTALRGGKVSEDIVVPLERLAEAIAATREIGERHRLPACSWGHAGDGNLHSTFMVDLGDPAELQRSHDAAAELFALAARLGGSVSGEHGIGLLKRGALAHQWAEPALTLHESIKRLLDPKGLLNPGKKLAR